MLAHFWHYVKNKSLAVGWGIAIIGLAVTFLPWPKITPKVAITLPAATALRPHNPTAFDNLSLNAKAVIVYNLNTEETIFEKDSQEIKPLASITKLITALTASDYLNNDDIIKIEAVDLAQGSNAGLEKNHTWRFIDLRDYMLTTSSNGAALAIARATSQKTGQSFDTLMTVKAKSLNLNSMSFGNPTGLTTTLIPKGTAADVALLLKYIKENKPELLSSTRWSSVNKVTVDKKRYLGVNTNQTVNTLMGLLGSKTGFTDEAGGNLAIYFDAGLNTPVAVVVLDSTYDGRFNDVEKLVKATLSYYAN